MIWDLEHAEDVLGWYRDFIRNAPDHLNGFFAFPKIPPGPPFPEELYGKDMCGVVWCYTGHPDAADVVFDPIRRDAGRPALDLVTRLPYPVLQSMLDPLAPAGLHSYWRADFVSQLNNQAIAEHLRHGSEVPNAFSGMHLYPINGAASRVDRHATAFSYRDATWCQVIVGADSEPANMRSVVDWTKAYWEALHPFSAGGAYLNMMMEEGVDRVRAAYRDNLPQLVAVKNRYDPRKLFG